MLGGTSLIFLNIVSLHTRAYDLRFKSLYKFILFELKTSKQNEGRGCVIFLLSFSMFFVVLNEEVCYNRKKYFNYKKIR